MRFPDAFLIELKFRNDIEDVVSRYVQLKMAGSNSVACCPFHSEKTPSFTVFRNTKSFHCFGCGAGGDVITFVMLIENTDYVSAVTKLADMARIPVPVQDDGEYKEKAIKQKRIFEINREAALYFHNNLIDEKNPESRKALEYLKNRGLKNATIKHFGLGYASNSWNNLTKYLSDKGFSKEEQKTAFLSGMTKNGDYIDYFRGRVIFPIIDLSANVIAFGGRVLDNKDMPKYLNSSDTPVFKKSRNLYALNFAKNVIGTQGSGQAKKFDYFIMCEGYMDVISMHQAGFTNAVATLGTAVTAEQARLMSKYAKRAVLAYDTDEAGKRAMKKAAELLGEVGIEVKVLQLGDVKDPDEFIKKYGRDRLENQLKKPKGYIESKLDAIYEKYDLSDNNNAEEKYKALDELCDEISLISSEIKREVYGINVAEKLKMPYENLVKEINRRAKKHSQKEKSDFINSELRKIDGYGDRINPDRVKYPGSVKKEEIVLGILLKYPELYGDVKNLLNENLFLSDFGRKIYDLYKTAQESGTDFDTVMITRDLTAEETGRITGMMFLKEVPENNIKISLENYIDVLEKQNKVYEKKNTDIKEIAALGDDAMIDFIEKQRKVKKGG